MTINKSIVIRVSLIAVLSLSRLFPHPPNFTPLLAMAVFSGASLNQKVLAYSIPIIAMF